MHIECKIDWAQIYENLFGFNLYKIGIKQFIREYIRSCELFGVLLSWSSIEVLGS